MFWGEFGILPQLSSVCQTHKMSSEDSYGSTDAVIDVDSCTWGSEADYDSDGEKICVCCPPEDAISTAEALATVDDPPTLEDSVRWYEAERSARHELYAMWCLDARVRLASLSLYTDDNGRAAFVRLPDYSVVTATVNDLIARGYQGAGQPPQM